MCTVSWRGGEGEVFELFFNRDERRAREEALPPVLEVIEGRQSLFPLDPVGGGTWVGGNDAGLVLCLLNDYRTEPVLTEGLQSRGLLVKQGMGCGSLQEVDRFVREQLKSFVFAPFRLLCFDTKEKKRRMWWWDQGELKHEDGFCCPVTSSSWRSKEVEERRIQLFETFVKGEGEDLQRYHAHQIGGEAEWSVCMSRELTQTVSLTRVCVDEKEVVIRYAPRDGEAGFRERAEEQHMSLNSR